MTVLFCFAQNIHHQIAVLESLFLVFFYRKGMQKSLGVLEHSTFEKGGDM